ncbi:MAG: ABC transporter ATP-binding protein [Myxococcota bacterium]|nr:ABC transporter ATP-binding protein [Myxococcota bacterium]
MSDTGNTLAIEAGARQLTVPDRETLPIVLDAKDVTVVIERRVILHGVTFWIPKGEFVCLCGPNGAGKSTFLKAVLGLLQPTAGSIEILGKPAHEGRHAVGYVPQRKSFDRDFPARAIDLIVANIRGTWPFRITPHERERARKVLRRVGGEVLLERPIASLSGGETQRVFLARALVNDPALLILDEPTAGVDVKGRAEFLELLAEVSASDELAAILVTHNLAAIARTAERVVYLSDGHLTAWGLPHELLGRRSFEALSPHDAGPSTYPDED